MKNILIGIGMLVLAFYMLWEQGKQQQEFLEQNRSSETVQPELINDANTTLRSDDSFSLGKGDVEDNNLNQSTTRSTFDESIQKEELFEGLSNNFSSLVFTNHNGGIREVSLKQFSRLSRDYNMTHPGEPLLSLSFEDESGKKLIGDLSVPKKYKRIESENQSVVYRWELPNKLRIERIYIREDSSTYVFSH